MPVTTTRVQLLLSNLALMLTLLFYFSKVLLDGDYVCAMMGSTLVSVKVAGKC